MSRYLDILGLKIGASLDEIKKKYKKLAMKYHPDRIKGEKEKKVAEEKLKTINEAYTILTKTPEAAHAQQNYESGVMRGGGIYAVYVSLETALRGGEAFTQTEKIEPCEECKGQGYDMDSDGTVCKVCGGVGKVDGQVLGHSVNRNCGACSGRGRMPDVCQSCNGVGVKVTINKVMVPIPAGVYHGFKLQKTDYETNTIHIIAVHVMASKYYELYEGGMLHTKIPITLEMAIFGGDISINTIMGEKLKITIPANIKNGTKLRLSGRGAKFLIPGMKRGDLVCEIEIMGIKNLDEKQKKLMKKLFATMKESQNHYEKADKELLNYHKRKL